MGELGIEQQNQSRKRQTPFDPPESCHLPRNLSLDSIVFIRSCCGIGFEAKWRNGRAGVIMGCMMDKAGLCSITSYPITNPGRQESRIEELAHSWAVNVTTHRTLRGIASETVVRALMMKSAG
ncbi:hypothetical protein WG66_011983 [Moniliophthora roreri]|nr:hypothetical protein WG66_011983 [Moniliophthora roreri]